MYTSVHRKGDHLSLNDYKSTGSDMSGGNFWTLHVGNRQLLPEEEWLKCNCVNEY